MSVKTDQNAVQDQQPGKQPNTLPCRDYVALAPPDNDRGPDHVRKPELGRGQADDLSEDVQPADHPPDDSALFTGHELRRRSVPEV